MVHTHDVMLPVDGDQPSNSNAIPGHDFITEVRPRSPIILSFSENSLSGLANSRIELYMEGWLRLPACCRAASSATVQSIAVG